MVAIIDATGLVLGRMATHIAKRLIEGEEIEIVNCEKAIVTGTEKRVKANYMFKRDVGTHRKGPFFPRIPHMMVKRTIRGMIPYQKPSGREAYKRLKCHLGVPREFAGKEFETITIAENRTVQHMTLENLARDLGANL
ncbi:MAG: 50S ribosomal protein L13 [Thermoplasmata archaeon HGW-Thermoplasmata-1]|nr:MAG: 50S ribosomal protein L13 [Thermoplasmata archaeon HGW-Thermoplasmata-1]